MALPDVRRDTERVMDETPLSMDDVRFSQTKQTKYKYKRDFRRTQTETTELHSHSVEPSTAKPTTWVRDWEAAGQLRDFCAQEDKEG
jgi:hypothetical protein